MGHHDVRHHRGRGVRQGRVVQIREQAGIAPEGRRQEGEIVHVARGTLPALHHRPVRAVRPGSTPASQGAKRIASVLRWVRSMKAPQGASGCVTRGVIGKRFAAAAVEGSRRRVR